MSEKLFKLLKESRINEEAIIEVPEKDIEAPESEIDELSAEEVAEVEEETGKEIPVVEEGIENSEEKEELDEVKTVGNKVVLKAYDISEIETPEIPNEFNFSMLEFQNRIKEKYHALGLNISNKTDKYNSGNDFYLIPDGELGAGLKVPLVKYRYSSRGYSGYYSMDLESLIESLASDENFDTIGAEELIEIAERALNLKASYMKEIEEMSDGEQAKIDAYKASDLGKSFWYTEDGHIICKKSKAKIISLESKLNEAPVDILVDKTDEIYDFDELDDEAKEKARDYDKPDSFYNSSKLAINKFLKPDNILSILKSEFPEYSYNIYNGYGGTDLGTVSAQSAEHKDYTDTINVRLEKETNNTTGAANVVTRSKVPEIRVDAVKMSRLLRSELNAVKAAVKNRFSAEAEKQAKLNNRQYYKDGSVYYDGSHESRVNQRLRSDESLEESKTSYHDQFAKVINKMLKDPMTDLDIEKEIKDKFNSALEECMKNFKEEK